MNPPAGSGRWSPSPEYLAQVTHVLGAAVIILLANLHGLNVWYTALGIAIVTGIKEFWADTYWLEHDTFAGDLNDWMHYLFGCGIALIVLDYFWLGVIMGALLVLFMALFDMFSNTEMYD